MDGVFSVIVRTMSVQGDGRIALWKCGFVSTYQGWHIIRRRGQHWWFGQCHFQLGFGNKLLRLTRRGIFGDEFTMVTSSIFYGTTNIVLKDDGTIPRWQWISMSGSLLTKYNWNRQDRAWSNSKPDFRGFWHNFCLLSFFLYLCRIKLRDAWRECLRSRSTAWPTYHCSKSSLQIKLDSEHVWCLQLVDIAHPIAQEGEHKCCDIEEIHKDFNMRISFSPQLSFIIRKSFQKDSGTKCWNLVGLSRAFRPPKPDLISVPIIRLKFPIFKSHFYERNGGPLSSFDCAKSRIMGVSLFEGRNLDREFTEFCSWPLFKFLLVRGKL